MIQSPTYILTSRLFSRFCLVGKFNPVGKRYYTTKIEGHAHAMSFLRIAKHATSKQQLKRKKVQILRNESHYIIFI